MTATGSALLAEQRRRMLATAHAEHIDVADLDDPHGDQARGVDPDAAYDAHQENAWPNP